jgi:hypothetical protein
VAIRTSEHSAKEESKGQAAAKLLAPLIKPLPSFEAVVQEANGRSLNAQRKIEANLLGGKYQLSAGALSS